MAGHRFSSPLGRGVGSTRVSLPWLTETPSPISTFEPVPDPDWVQPRGERIERINVAHVRRLTGGFPDGRRSTLTMGDVLGTDLGHMFSADGAVYMVFGDTYGRGSTLPPDPTVPPDALKEWRSNAMAIIGDPASLPRVGLEAASMVTSRPGYAQELVPGLHGPNDGSGEVTKIPTNGISVDGLLILHVMSVNHWVSPGYWLVDHSVLYHAEDPAGPWTRSDVWWDYGNFAQVAFVRHGRYVYLFGIPPGRYGEVKLARVAADAVLRPEAYRYLAGHGAWVANHEDAVAIVPRPVGELSVMYNEFLERWIMLHIQPGFRDPADPRFAGQPAIVVREAVELTGPWSEPRGVWPDGYGPYMHPSLVQGRGSVIYFTLSFWRSPVDDAHYNVHLMEAAFNVDAAIPLTPGAVAVHVEGEAAHPEPSGWGESVEPTTTFHAAVLLVRWQQPSPTGFPATWYENYFCNDREPGVAGFWWSQTQGTVRFEGRVVDWFDLDARPEDLVDVRPDGSRRIGRAAIANQAVTQAMEAGALDPHGVDGFVVVTDVAPPAGWSGVDAGATPVDATATLAGGIVSVRATGQACVLPVGSVFDFSAHEFGHVLRLDHSFSSDVFDDQSHEPGEYGHHACIMSASLYGGSDSQYDLDVVPAELSTRGPALNGATRVARGWARAVEIRLEPGLKTVQTLISLHAPPADPSIRAIHLLAAPDETYTVDFRDPADRAESTLLCPMVMIHQLRGSTADRAHPGTDSATYLGEIHAEVPMPLDGRPPHRHFDGPGFRIELLDIIENRVAVVRVIDRRDVPRPPALTIPAVYGRLPSGKLLWYRHEGHYNASGIWASREIADGLHDLRLFAGGQGVLYAIDRAGNLLWRRHAAHQSGDRQWTSDWIQVGSGWNMYGTVFSNGGGAVYGVDPAGDLYWYHHDGHETGGDSWTRRRLVGTGWSGFRAIVPAGEGVVYALEHGGALRWYRHVGHADGTQSWHGPRAVDAAWDAYGRVFAADSGVVYAVASSNGDLVWRRHLGRADGSPRWTDRKRVGRRWESFDFLAVS
jgi:hypothetical protein